MHIHSFATQQLTELTAGASILGLLAHRSGVTAPTPLSRGLSAVWSNVCIPQELVSGVSAQPGGSAGAFALPGDVGPAPVPPRQPQLWGNPGTGPLGLPEKQHTSPRCYGNAPFKTNE